MAEFTADQAAVASAMAVQPSAVETPEGPPAAPQAAEEALPKRDYRDFDPRHKESFAGLLYVGQLDDEFVLYGHKFRIATPRQTERLQIGPMTREFQDTSTQELAYQAAVVALYLISIDGQELPQPVLLNIKDGALRDRFNWVCENIRRPIINALFDKCWILEAEVDATLEAMGKASA